jgi:hypothetical protein
MYAYQTREEEDRAMCKIQDLCDRGYVQDLVRPLGGVCVAQGACFPTALAYGDDRDFRISLRVDVRSRKTGCSCETRSLLYMYLA